MRFGRTDPGDCLVCGAAHCSCGGPGLEVAQLPNRDAAAALERAAPASAAETVQATLPAGSFTSGTYRGRETQS
jgi:hypothetical protein